MIKAIDLSHSFGEKVLFKDLSFKVEHGIYALCGKSGSGKTTLLKILAGLIKPESGTFEADTPVSVSFQENRLLPWYSVLKNVELVSDKETAKRILTELGLEKELNSLPKMLSGGMKKRVSIARSLAYNSSTLLLDEPFAGLDEETARITLDVIKKYSLEKTVLISTHNIDIAQNLNGIISI